MTTAGKNMGTLTLLHGGRYATRQTSAERAMEQKVRERVARRIAQDARKQEKALYNVAGDVTHPTRFLSRLYRLAKASKWTHEEAREAFITPQIEMLEALYRTGEFRPAA
jgi:hypothetical protein